MTFRDREKQRYAGIKHRLFSPAACEPGAYNGRLRDFCLAAGHSAENLFAAFRDDAIAYFRERGISWHDGLATKAGASDLPSNHLCCSQCACVNSMWPLTRDAHTLACVFGPFLPGIECVLPIYCDGPLSADGRRPFMAFEWIGTRNYLCEVGNRRRGANATSADFAFRFRRRDGAVQLVLGQWKYTEYYTTKAPSQINQTQLRVYREAFEHWKAGQPGLPRYEAFFVEPFYQLMRLTLLAQQMERACASEQGEMGADIVSVVLVVPEANREYAESFTAPALREYGNTVPAAWTRIASEKRLAVIPTESLLETIDRVAPSNLRPWSDYLMLRYGWWQP